MTEKKLWEIKHSKNIRLYRFKIYNPLRWSVLYVNLVWLPIAVVQSNTNLDLAVKIFC